MEGFPTRALSVYPFRVTPGLRQTVVVLPVLAFATRPPSIPESEAHLSSLRAPPIRSLSSLFSGRRLLPPLRRSSLRPTLRFFSPTVTGFFLPPVSAPLGATAPLRCRWRFFMLRTLFSRLLVFVLFGGYFFFSFSFPGPYRGAVS